MFDFRIEKGIETAKTQEKIAENSVLLSLTPEEMEMLIDWEWEVGKYS
jgi:hypothetical protein